VLSTKLFLKNGYQCRRVFDKSMELIKVTATNKMTAASSATTITASLLKNYVNEMHARRQSYIICFQ